VGSREWGEWGEWGEGEEWEEGEEITNDQLPITN